MSNKHEVKVCLERIDDVSLFGISKIIEKYKTLEKVYLEYCCIKDFDIIGYEFDYENDYNELDQYWIVTNRLETDEEYDSRVISEKQNSQYCDDIKYYNFLEQKLIYEPSEETNAEYNRVRGLIFKHK